MLGLTLPACAPDKNHGPVGFARLSQCFISGTDPQQIFAGLDGAGKKEKPFVTNLQGLQYRAAFLLTAWPELLTGSQRYCRDARLIQPEMPEDLCPHAAGVCDDVRCISRRVFYARIQETHPLNGVVLGITLYR